LLFGKFIYHASETTTEYETTEGLSIILIKASLPSPTGQNGRGPTSQMFGCKVSCGAPRIVVAGPQEVFRLKNVFLVGGGDDSFVLTIEPGGAGESFALCQVSAKAPHATVDVPFDGEVEFCLEPSSKGRVASATVHLVGMRLGGDDMDGVEGDEEGSAPEEVAAAIADARSSNLKRTRDLFEEEDPRGGGEGKDDEFGGESVSDGAEGDVELEAPAAVGSCRATTKHVEVATKTSDELVDEPETGKRKAWIECGLNERQFF